MRRKLDHYTGLFLPMINLVESVLVAFRIIPRNLENLSDEACSWPSLDLMTRLRESAMLVLIARYGISMPAL